jgi:nucleoside-diphosphate-sugar epimerase
LTKRKIKRLSNAGPVDKRQGIFLVNLLINGPSPEKVCLVTGAAGFIGSHLVRRLLSEGHRVTGIDSFTDYYDPKIKWHNIADLLQHPQFDLIEDDLIEALESLPQSVNWVFHQAAQAGVRASWGREFEIYTRQNILATQRLLEWAHSRKPERFVYASSSSVYGDVEKMPMQEEDPLRPLSPYGVSKLAAENLCTLYHKNFGLPTVSLRYFTVYGPGQRPDMAFHRFFKAIMAAEELTIYGSGEQTRDFTYISDIISANLAAATRPQAAGRIYNIGGGSRITVNGVLKLLAEITAKQIKVKHEAVQAGDPPHTFADTARANAELGFRPQTGIEEGLKKMYVSFQEKGSA